MNESLRQPIRNRLTDRVGKHFDTGKAAETRDDFCQVRDVRVAVLYHSRGSLGVYLTVTSRSHSPDLTDLHICRRYPVNDPPGISPEYELAKTCELITKGEAGLGVGFENKELLEHPRYCRRSYAPEVIDGGSREDYARLVFINRPPPGAPSLRQAGCRTQSSSGRASSSSRERPKVPSKSSKGTRSPESVATRERTSARSRRSARASSRASIRFIPIIAATGSPCRSRMMSTSEAAATRPDTPRRAASVILKRRSTVDTGLLYRFLYSAAIEDLLPVASLPRSHAGHPNHIRQPTAFRQTRSAAATTPRSRQVFPAYLSGGRRDSTPRLLARLWQSSCHFS